jgi:hypothetical protein
VESVGGTTVIIQTLMGSDELHQVLYAFFYYVNTVCTVSQ